MKSIEDAYKDRHEELGNYIRGQVSSREAAEDILHDIFERAIRADLTEPIENVVAWLFRAASRRIIDWYRKKFRTDISLDKEEFSLSECIGSIDADFSDDIVRKAVKEELFKAIDQLPAEQREVIVRQALYGETFREIAEEKNLPTNTLIARKRYAVENLRQRLSGMEDVIKELNT